MGCYCYQMISSRKCTPCREQEARDAETSRLRAEIERLQVKVTRLKSAIRYVALDAYRAGRDSGHEDTVEGRFLPYTYAESADVFGSVVDEIISGHILMRKPSAAAHPQLNPTGAVNEETLPTAQTKAG